MSTPDDFNVNAVYEYKTAEDLKRYYNDWAHEYNAYCDAVKYALPRIVAETFSERFIHERGLIVDIGCGTGLLGKNIHAKMQYVDIHGIDLSEHMVSIALTTNDYKMCSILNVKERDQISHERLYDGMVSAGTFTSGHLEACDLSNTFALLKPGALVVMSVKNDHYLNSGFEEELKNLLDSALISDIDITEVNAYDTEFKAANQIISFFVNTQNQVKVQANG